jgi:hypothetical protein
MAVAGLTRLRKHQFGRQSAIDTPVAAVKAYPFSGVPSVDPTWTDPDIDVGSLDPVVSPYRGPGDYTASLTDPALWYNCLPLMLSAMLGDGVTGSGTPDVNWVYAPASATVDAVDTFTYEFGDDVTSDWYQLGGGLLESLEFTAPDGLSAVQASMSWRFGSAFGSGFTDFPDAPVVPTAALNLEQNAAVVYLKDASIAIASDPDDFATSTISDALYSFVLRFSTDVDQKRWANGTQSFAVQDYSRATRSIELECTFAKTSDIVGTGSESDAWFSESAVNRFVQVSFESLVEADTATPYSWVFSMPMRYYTRTEGEIGGNSTVVLTGHAFYDPNGSATDFDGVFKSTVVNTQASI